MDANIKKLLQTSYCEMDGNLCSRCKKNVREKERDARERETRKECLPERPMKIVFFLFCDNFVPRALVILGTRLLLRENGKFLSVERLPRE